MAYVVDLDDEFTDTDIPTTLIRSKADCPSMEVLSFGTAELQLPELLTNQWPWLSAASRLSGSDDSDNKRHCDLEAHSDPVVPPSGNSAQEAQEEGQR